ncbi:Alpha/beta hydrolase family protein [compost metagenome]|nr:alpha/beta hydrolase [Serratia plymuthica]QPS89983.1 alpha/beta fold hydrolase [Serratia plymuthica]
MKLIRRFLLKRKIVVTLAVTSSILAFILYQNNYQLVESTVTIPHKPNNLDAVLAMPRHLPPGEKPGVVIFVHGDGDINATHGGFYRPIWEALSKAGFSSLSWNKPGVGGAPGNWLQQSMDDRTSEVISAIDWIKHQPQLDGQRIALWGASQGGWVLPKVATRYPDICFMIAVSPAVNWLEQGRYNTIASMKQKGRSESEIAAELKREQQVLALLDANASFEQYQQKEGNAADFTADRWTFVMKNYRSDATQDLAQVHSPVFLALGGKDINVDIKNTENEYRKRLNKAGQLDIKFYPQATHSMLEKSTEDSLIETWYKGLLFPRAIFYPGFLQDQQDFAWQHRHCQ